MVPVTWKLDKPEIWSNRSSSSCHHRGQWHIRRLCLVFPRRLHGPDGWRSLSSRRSWVEKLIWSLCPSWSLELSLWSSVTPVEPVNLPWPILSNEQRSLLPCHPEACHANPIRFQCLSSRYLWRSWQWHKSAYLSSPMPLWMLPTIAWRLVRSGQSHAS